MKTLRVRLAGLYTITTGAILLFVMAAFLISSVQKTRNAQLRQFEIIWNSLSSRFQSAQAFSYSFLARTEADYKMVIHISENGTPFLYPGSWKPDTDRRLLIEQAKSLAEKEGIFMDQPPVSSSVSISSLMTLKGEQNDCYYAMVLTLASKKGAKSLCAISYIPSVWESICGTLVYLCLLAVLGITCLWLISWKFVSWSLKPVEESQQKQARFLAAASHELRSPLAVLRSALAAAASSPQKQDTLLPLMDKECVRMSRLIDDMLLLASADAKTWSLKMDSVDMDTLLIDLFETFQPVCREKGISFQLKLPEKALPPVMGDSQRLCQLFMVLLDNAGNHTPPGRSICLCARVCSKKHVLTVQVIDEGCGIPPEHQPYIFDRFYQADSSRSDKQHFGLGLSIAKELTELHHGTICVSDNPQGGSCFSVTLPYYESLPPAAAHGGFL